ncbi:MAG: sugar ABC transporter substrate-binding protein [Christensenellaceae bacterium]|jgi:ABC-type sugar transport system substrate-binding protein
MKKTLSVALALLLVLMLAVACGGDKNESQSPSEDKSVAPTGSPSVSADEKEGYYLAGLYSEITGDFWGVVYNGGKKAIEELRAQGHDGYIIAPANYTDITLQQEQINQAIIEKADGIVLGPVNADSIGTYITDTFTDDSMSIVVIDNTLNSTSPAVKAEVMADTAKMGTECGKMGVAAMNGKGYYVPLGIDITNANWANRSLYAIEYIEENAPDMENLVTDNEYGVWWWGQNPEGSSMQYIQDTLTVNPEKDILFLTTAEAFTNEVVAALSELKGQIKGEVQIVGFDFSAVGYGLFSNTEAFYGTCGQNPFLMGYLGFYTLLDVINGELETGDAPVMIEVPYQNVTRENLNSEEVKEYVKSMGIEYKEQ